MNKEKEEINMETVRKASGRGKPGDKPEIPRGVPRDINE